ncbi:hypothetical protein [Glutamicibacter sp. PS]|uniref:hypothetical protein n=1 Tax=Glutamicibacter sp. PS TaxID=3075634 RepID=UPI002844C75F|nr:hypothetical protein [Glutamicibacter sp. PS]MDR4534578.1 hypothetical protein [Glutamicibacter sp. PS]
MTFVVSLGIALCGGILFVLWQSIGLVLGDAAILLAPNGLFKIVLCVAASLASIAAYLLLHVGSSPREYAEKGKSQ